MGQSPASLRQVTWWQRHAVVILLAGLAVYAFGELRAEWSAMHRWNRAVGDVSLVLVSLAMAVGPLGRIWRRASAFLPWRREFGIWATVLAIVHTAIILGGWVEWNLIRLFGYEFHPGLGQYVMLQHGFALANAIGILALFYAAILGLTSNNWSQKILGGSVWKFLQQGAYVLWSLVLVHTAYFLYVHFQDFHRRVPEPNELQVPFVILVLFVISLQIIAFWKTWRGRRKQMDYAPA